MGDHPEVGIDVNTSRSTPSRPRLQSSRPSKKGSDVVVGLQDRLAMVKDGKYHPGASNPQLLWEDYDSVSRGANTVGARSGERSYYSHETQNRGRGLGHASMDSGS